MLYYFNLFYSKNKMRDIYRKVRSTKTYTVDVKQTVKVPLIGSLYHIHVEYIPDKLSIINGNIINDGDYLYVYVKFDNSEYQTLIQGKYDIDVYTTETMTVNGINIPIRNIVQINKNDKVVYYEKDDTNFFIRNIPFYSLVFYNDDGEIYTGLGAAYPGDMISFKCINYWDGVIRNVNIILPDIKDTIQNPITINSSSYVELMYDGGFTKIVLQYEDNSYIKIPHLKLRKNNIMYNVFAIQIGEPVFWKNVYEIAMGQRRELQCIKDYHPYDNKKKKADISPTSRYHRICDIPKDKEYIGNIVYIEDHPIEYTGHAVFCDGKWEYIDRIEEAYKSDGDISPFKGMIEKRFINLSIPEYNYIYDIPEYEEYDGSVVRVENHSVKYSGYVVYYKGRWTYAEEYYKHDNPVEVTHNEYKEDGSIKQTTSIKEVSKTIKDVSTSLYTDGIMFHMNDKFYSVEKDKLVEHNGELPKDAIVHFIY